ncbi:MAG: oligoendopeptidase F, partial [Alphaproteobacteria bacterium]|nr:oligoendopeptidase F [Alphaproteobacteria bacterium]
MSKSAAARKTSRKPKGSPARDKLGPLPEWDLTDLYASPESAVLRDDLADMRKASKAFSKRLQGKLAGLSGDKLAKAVSDYEKIDEVLSRIMSYASLLYSGDMTDPNNGRFYQSMRETVTEISSHLLFFDLEINRIPDRTLSKKLKESKRLARYEPWLRDVRAFREHQLDDELEKLLHEKSVAGRAAWNRLFDETMAELQFEVDLPKGKRTLGSAEALNLLSDRDGAVRKAAAKALGKTLSENARVFTLITNTLAKDKEIEDKWRGFDRPVSSRNLSNFVEDEVVDALSSAVQAAYPDLSHRYYKLKAKWFGVRKLDHWDRNAPLPDNDDRLIRWDDAVDKVLGAYRQFSPELAGVAKDFFDNDWIDTPVRPGKSPGAFAHPTVPSAHPYLLLNYQGKSRDVMTLAHELGHG